MMSATALVVNLTAWLAMSVQKCSQATHQATHQSNVNKIYENEDSCQATKNPSINLDCTYLAHTAPPVK